MSVSTAPSPAPPKKRGCGCFGCGCFILILLGLLFLGLVAGIGYYGYTETIALTSSTPAAIPSFNGSDDLYQTARKKLADFDHGVKSHQAATIQLSADEINVMIARSPDVIKDNIHAFVTLTNNEGRVQASRPSDGLSQGLIKDRYFNFDASFEIHFDLATKNVNLTFHTLQFGNKAFLGQGASNSSFDQSTTLLYTSIFNQSLTAGIRKNPDGAALLDQAKSIEIKDGELVIQTQ